MMLRWASQTLEKLGTKQLRRNPKHIHMFYLYEYGISEGYSSPSVNTYSQYSNDIPAFSYEDHHELPRFQPNPKVWSPPAAKVSEDYEKLAEIIHSFGVDNSRESNGDESGWASDVDDGKENGDDGYIIDEKRDENDGGGDDNINTEEPIYT